MSWHKSYVNKYYEDIEIEWYGAESILRTEFFELIFFNEYVSLNFNLLIFKSILEDDGSM